MKSNYTKKKTFGKKCKGYLGPIIFNSIPILLKTSRKVDVALLYITSGQVAHCKIIWC